MGGTAFNSLPVDGKSQLRRRLRQQRAAVAMRIRREHAARCARRALRALRARNARRVAVYLAYRSELSTEPLIEGLLQQGVRVYVPRLVGDDMHMIELRSDTQLRRNRHGIAEPCARDHARPRQLDAIVLPLTGFDAHGHRLGTGGGYYDRFLAGLHGRQKPWLLGYAYALQQCESVPADPWDVRLHAVCTERGLIRFPP
ncbi:5-formyltetrahydrofolate cyclo-ligase [Hydrocarboniphaga sp.]|uniref:5-formyltetrahydrofolate cyclo-ligase n=1 Tax=Hydrocarboniphaga sp. TaxID=2033016 RepID=UPI003453BBE8